MNKIKLYFKWLRLYFLLWKHFRKYNLFTIEFKVDSNTANYFFRFKKLKDLPIISFYYPEDHEIIIFFHVAKKCNNYYHEIHSIEGGLKLKEMIEYLKSFVPNFIDNYDTLYSENRDVMEKNIINMINGIKRKSKIDSII